jgi:hypothetical protein
MKESCTKERIKNYFEKRMEIGDNQKLSKSPPRVKVGIIEKKKSCKKRVKPVLIENVQTKRIKFKNNEDFGFSNQMKNLKKITKKIEEDFQDKNKKKNIVNEYFQDFQENSLYDFFENDSFVSTTKIKSKDEIIKNEILKIEKSLKLIKSNLEI